ncbi:hypothetical protein HGM15179_008233 [Zosterops borbonicus]|uniref:RNase H type-1 domain-containing protein n=1 Tax=Zosterops borbonicus TaxID=364589 RepID=A0A8K1GHC0_9PASS|nr:hypothetical protein HGM15179_008233 [Zosterops borbonicus]
MHIPEYSQMVSPLYLVTHKKSNFHWGPEQQQAFAQIKQEIAHAVALGPVRTGPDVRNVLYSTARNNGMNQKWKAANGAIWSPTREVTQTTEEEGGWSQLAELEAVQLALDIAEREKWPKLYLYTELWMVANALWGQLERCRKANWQRRGKPIWAADERKDIATWVEKRPVKVCHVDAQVPKRWANEEHQNNEQVDQAAKIEVSKIDLHWQHKRELLLAQWVHDALGHQGRDATYKWAQDQGMDLTMDSILRLSMTVRRVLRSSCQAGEAPMLCNERRGEERRGEERRGEERRGEERRGEERRGEERRGEERRGEERRGEERRGEERRGEERRGEERRGEERRGEERRGEERRGEERRGEERRGEERRGEERRGEERRGEERRGEERRGEERRGEERRGEERRGEERRGEERRGEERRGEERRGEERRGEERRGEERRGEERRGEERRGEERRGEERRGEERRGEERRGEERRGEERRGEERRGEERRGEERRGEEKFTSIYSKLLTLYLYKIISPPNRIWLVLSCISSQQHFCLTNGLEDEITISNVRHICLYLARMMSSDNSSFGSTENPSCLKLYNYGWSYGCLSLALLLERCPVIQIRAQYYDELLSFEADKDLNCLFLEHSIIL